MTAPSGDHRRPSRRTVLTAAVGTAGSLLLGGCGGASTLLDIGRERGFLRLGIANEKPFGYIDESENVTGMVPEVAARVLQDLGVPGVPGVIGVVTDFGRLISMLNRGAFDIIAAGMFVVPERCADVAFTAPIYCTGPAFAVRADAGVTEASALLEDGKRRIALLTGSAERDGLLALGVPTTRMREYPDFPSMGQAVLAGDVDALCLSRVNLRLAAPTMTRLRVLPPDPEAVPVVSGCGAFGFRRADTELRDAFDGEIDALAKSGALEAIATGFGFVPDELHEARAHTSAELCRTTLRTRSS